MDILRMVLATLDTIHVSGKEDMSKLLGVIGTLEALIKETEKIEAEETKDGR